MIPKILEPTSTVHEPCRESKYGEGMMYWTEIRYRGSLKFLGLVAFENIFDWVALCSLVVSNHLSTMNFYEFLTQTSALLLRNTKRRIDQEMEEWEEDVDPKKPRGGEKPQLQWGFMEDQEGVKPGYVMTKYKNKKITKNIYQPFHVFDFFKTCQHWSPSPWSGHMPALEDATEQERRPVAVPVEEESVKKEMEKLSFPTLQVEGDTAASALIPKACSSLQKYITKMDGLLAQFLEAPTLTPLQVKSLVCLETLSLGIPA